MELLITLSITTIGLIGLMALHGSVVRGNDSSSHTAEAQVVANATLESLRAQRIGEMVQTLTGSISTPPINVVMTDMTGRNGQAYRRRCLISTLSGSTSLWRVRVEVGWTDDGAVVGSDGGRYDHLLAVEVLRTVEEAL